MWTWLRELWTDPVAFRSAARALAFGVAFASTTAAGAKIMDGKVEAITNNQWIRFVVAVGVGTLGGSVASMPKARE